MDRSVYRRPLTRLVTELEDIPNTTMGMYVKVLILTVLNLRYEKIDFDHKSTIHPFKLLANILDEMICMTSGFGEIMFAESLDRAMNAEKPHDMEEKHKDLYNLLWNKKTHEGVNDQIGRFRHRLSINGLDETINGKRCLDIGCGNGSFCFALCDAGANSVAGIDYGEDSIAFANEICKRRGSESRISFVVGSAYQIPFGDSEFDVVIQNGVFHHLRDEDAAIREAVRVLKKGGVFWYYTEGDGALRFELFDYSIQILQDIPSAFVGNVMRDMNLSTNKIHHLMDCMNATCRKTTWKELTKRLTSFGFADFRVLHSDFPWEFDRQVIESDPYFKEKYGEGCLRILARRVS